MAKRVQLSRKKGWRMPENTVKVSRPTKWGNPSRISDFIEWTDPSKNRPDQPRRRAAAVERFRAWLWETAEGEAITSAASIELRGKNLACWCPLDQPCHADVLMEIANG